MTYIAIMTVPWVKHSTHRTTVILTVCLVLEIAHTVRLTVPCVRNSTHSETDGALSYT